MSKESGLTVKAHESPMLGYRTHAQTVSETIIIHLPIK